MRTNSLWTLSLALCFLGCETSPTNESIDGVQEELLPATSQEQNLPPPSINMPTGQVVLGPAGKLPILIKGVESARLRVVPISTAEFTHVSKYVGDHGPFEDVLGKLGRQFSARATTRVVAAEDPRLETRVELDPFVAVKGPGGKRAELLFVVLEAPGTYSRASVVQRGGLASLLKLGAQSGLVWVTRTSDGKPQAAARVTITQGQSVRFTGYTDTSGILKLPARSRLYLPSANKDAEQPLVVRAETSHALALQSERWSDGVDTWSYGLPSSYWEDAEGLRGIVTAERGIFRPGETVNLLGVLRKRDSRGKLQVPRGAFELSVRDPDGNEVLKKTLRPTRFGTLRSDLKLPTSSRLGSYHVRLASGKGDLSSTFEVGKYRAAHFEVKLGGTLDEAEGGTLVLPVSANYLWGAPVKRGKVRYSISTRQHQSYNDAGFSFGNGSGTSSVQRIDADLELDEQGNGKIQISPDLIREEQISQTIDLVINADVSDAGGDSVSTQVAIPRATGSAAVGLKNDSWAVNPTRGWDIEVLAQKPDGAPAAGKAIEVTLHRRYWKSYTEETSYGSRYRGGWEEDVVETKRVKASATASRVHFALPAGGDYRVEARIAGEQAYAETRVWAYGGGAYGAADNNPRMSIQADKQSYAPGDTAKLFVASPFAKSTALVTLEREGIISAYTTELKGAERPVEVPLAARHLPNVFVSVAAVSFRQNRGGPSAGAPFRMGYTNLEVSPEERRLKVELKPLKQIYEPGQEALVDVLVKDQAGHPASAEVTLWAADEGVLMLTGYQTPDPFAPLYAEHDIDVRSSSSLMRFVSPDPLYWDNTGGDYGGGGGEGAFRSRFLGTAFFSKRGVVTDRSGKARVKLPLPDNLTRWRVMAAAADAGQRFGRSEASITTKKRVQVVPALPRFLTVGDTADLGFVVHEQAGKGRPAKFRLSLESGSKSQMPASIDGESQREFDLTPDGQRALKFRVKAEHPGDLVVKARLEAGADQDAVKVTIPVQPRLPYTKLLVGDGRIEKSASVAIKMPDSAQSGVGSLELSLSSSVLASLQGGIDSLLEYPHGCVEQTTSRLIPLVMLEELMRRSGDSRLSGSAHHRRMDAAIAHVLEHQNQDGGFGLWPSSDSEGFLTAYALWGLTTAKSHGYSVARGIIERGFGYLKQHMEDGDDMHGQFSSLETKPFAAFVFADSSREDSGLGKRLAGTQGLSRFAAGLLGTALASKPEGSALVSALEQARQTTPGGGALVPELKELDTFSYGKDLRSTAISVRALVDAGKLAQAEPLVLGVLSKRAPDGSWGTTYNNLWALYALTSYAEHSAGDGRGLVDVFLGDKRIGSATLDATHPTRRFEIDARDLPAPGKTLALRLEARGGTPRYSALLRFVDTELGKQPEEHGLTVTRTLLDAETSQPVTDVKQGQLLKVRLSVSSPQPRAQIAVQDALPAGFEAIDTRLKTATRAADVDGSWIWNWRELHDERVTFFADWFPAGTREAEYLVRATRSGRFVRPPARAEAMYDPAVWAFSTSQSQTVR
ncbi:MAG: hypothetical protein KC766_35845 [Myxococcales bacterium]|nr:hypothetical protein [Myxococcales bacterium]